MSKYNLNYKLLLTRVLSVYLFPFPFVIFKRLFSYFFEFAIRIMYIAVASKTWIILYAVYVEYMQLTVGIAALSEIASYQWF